MIAEIILVPLAGFEDTAKANAQCIARSLSAVGIKVREQISLCDNITQLQQAVSTGLSRSNILLTIGGLGAQADFMVKNVLAQGLSLPLEHNESCVESIRAYCTRSGERFSLEDAKLARLPRGSSFFSPMYGKIPGCAISSSRQHIIMLPETELEVIPMFNRYVPTYLNGSASTTTITRTVRTFGISVDSIGELLGELLLTTNPAITVHKENAEVLIRVSAHATTAQGASTICTPFLRDIVTRMGDAAYGLDVDSLQTAVITKLEKKNLGLAIAEAGMGGIFTRVIGETPGGPEILRYSVALDTDSAKKDKLGLNIRLIKKKGRVSEYTAVAMAAAAREKSDTDIGVAIVANSGDYTTRKCPLGLVYIAVCNSRNVYVKKLVVGDGSNADYDSIVDAALSRSLNMLRLFVDYLPVKYPGAIPLVSALNGETVTNNDSYDTTDEPAKLEVDKLEEAHTKPQKIKTPASKGAKVKKVIFAATLLVFLSSVSYLGYTYYQSYANKQMANELLDMFEYSGERNVEVAKDYPTEFSKKFAGLWNINNDIVAFITIEDTQVKYPVVQAEDNDYYLRRDFYGNKNSHGVPFMDYRVDVSRPSDNMVIYGHNMKDGQIFGEIIPYQNLDYYKAHPLIHLSTVYAESDYQVFSVFISNAYQTEGDIFNYNDFINSPGDAGFMRYVQELQSRSLINTGVDVQPGDELITLSTCTYDFKDARFVVVARKLRSGEGKGINTADAVLNSSPLMPDIWHKTKGTIPENGLGAPVYQVPESSAVEAMASVEERIEVSPQRNLEIAQSQLDALSAAEQTSLSSSSTTTDTSASAVFAASSAAQSEAKEIADAKSKADADAKSQSDADVKAKADADAQAKAIAEADAKSKADADAKAKSEADAKSKADADAKSKAKADAKSQSDADAKSLSEAEMLENMSASSQLPPASAQTLSVYSGGTKITGEAADILPRIVQSEMGANFNPEAIKAQAVAAYSFILNSNNSGTTPAVVMASSADSRVKNAVTQVVGQGIYYNGKVAFTPYHATSAGNTTSSSAVWGGNYPYLVSVDSNVDESVPNFRMDTKMTRTKVEDLLYSKLGITTTDDPSTWFAVLDYAQGGYNGNMTVAGYSKSQKTNSTITGRLLRESVLNLRSACFTTEYDADTDSFTFTTYGYGHGVGMSQNGANLLAKDGWSYEEILEHYYPGTQVQ